MRDRGRQGQGQPGEGMDPEEGGQRMDLVAFLLFCQHLARSRHSAVTPRVGE